MADDQFMNVDAHMRERYRNPGDPVSVSLELCRRCGTVVGYYHHHAYREADDDVVDGPGLHRCPADSGGGRGDS